MQNEEEDDASNNVLFVENLPPQATEPMLNELFSQYPGFQDIKLVAERQIAVVEFEDDAQATLAMKGLDGYKMSAEHPLKINYAKQR